MSKPLKILLISVGTRGDIEPFLAIGEYLQEMGHRVQCAFPEQFASLAEESGLDFASLGTQFIQLIQSEDGRQAMGGTNWRKRLSATFRLALRQKPASKEVLLKQQRAVEDFQPDLILYNPKAVYPIIWKLKNRGRAIFISPLPFMHYVKGHSHVGFGGQYGPLLNKWTYALANLGMLLQIRASEKWLGSGSQLSRRAILQHLKTGQSLYTISPALFPRPADWPESLQVVGHFERQNKSAYAPSSDLVEFLNRHPKILFITFGSMQNADPEGKTAVLLDILLRHHIPAIINIADGGLVAPAEFDHRDIFFVSGVPYHWIFPKVYAVLHHGGSGTTHLALKYGCASMIIPHIMDQFVWNRLLAKLGVGPLGVKIHRLNRRNAEPLILDLFHQTAYKKQAEAIQEQMQGEPLRSLFLREIGDTVTDN